MKEVKITSIANTERKGESSWHGCSDIIKFGNKYFQTYDAKNYNSGIEEITKKEYKELLKHKWGEYI